MKKLRFPFLHNPRFRYGSLSMALLCIGLALLVALNGLFTALEKRYGWRVDYSFNSITSHSETTEEVLSELNLPVHIYALYERGSEDLLLFELLDRYQDGRGEAEEQAQEAQEDGVAEHALAVDGLEEDLEVLQADPWSLHDGLKAARRTLVVLEGDDDAVHGHILEHQEEQDARDHHQMQITVLIQRMHEALPSGAPGDGTADRRIGFHPTPLTFISNKDI